MTGPEGAGRAFAMNEQITVPAIDRMPFDLAGIVGDVEQQAHITVGKKVTENAPCVVAEDLTIGECTVDRGPHRAEVALADLRVDRGAGEFAVSELDAGRFRGHHHLLQELGPDLVTEPARTAMYGHDDVVQREPEDAGDGGVENLGDRLDFEIVVARS